MPIYSQNMINFIYLGNVSSCINLPIVRQVENYVVW